MSFSTQNKNDCISRYPGPFWMAPSGECRELNNENGSIGVGRMKGLFKKIEGHVTRRFRFLQKGGTELGIRARWCESLISTLIPNLAELFLETNCFTFKIIMTLSWRHPHAESRSMGFLNIPLANLKVFMFSTSKLAIPKLLEAILYILHGVSCPLQNLREIDVLSFNRTKHGVNIKNCHENVAANEIQRGERSYIRIANWNVQKPH